MTIVTRKFRDDFETWAAHRIATGEWIEGEMENFKQMLRHDLAPGPDQVRAGLSAIIAAGVEVPAAINDHEERYRLWENFFSLEAECIRQSATTAR